MKKKNNIITNQSQRKQKGEKKNIEKIRQRENES